MFPEVDQAFKRLEVLGVKIYSQNVLLKGVNDDIEVLIDTYNILRGRDIEAHYLFHCIPMRGIHHLRTSVNRGLDLAKNLTGSGRVSGRAKPIYAAMSDVGKIIFYEGSILAREGRRILLQSQYKYNERISWNPSWQLPSAAEIDPDGLLRVWYVDGEDS
jgi:lysine 2,3-aminomutase